MHLKCQAGLSSLSTIVSAFGLLSFRGDAMADKIYPALVSRDVQAKRFNSSIIRRALAFLLSTTCRTANCHKGGRWRHRKVESAGDCALT